MIPSTESILDSVRDVVGKQLNFAVHGYEVGPDDNLWEWGMTSLNCVGLMLALEDTFDVELPESQLNEDTFRTINTMTSALASALHDKPERPDPLA